MDMRKHIQNCCKHHCKYNKIDCPVVNRLEKQETPCSDCSHIGVRLWKVVYTEYYDDGPKSVERIFLAHAHAADEARYLILQKYKNEYFLNPNGNWNYEIVHDPVLMIKSQCYD